MSTAPINRKSQRNENLSPGESVRVIGHAALIGQVETIVNRFRNPDGLDAAQCVAGWLAQHLLTIDGSKPADLVDTPPGQKIVPNLIAMTETGAYA